MVVLLVVVLASVFVVVVVVVVVVVTVRVYGSSGDSCSNSECVRECVRVVL